MQGYQKMGVHTSLKFKARQTTCLAENDPKPPVEAACTTGSERHLADIEVTNQTQYVENN